MGGVRGGFIVIQVTEDRFEHDLAQIELKDMLVIKLKYRSSVKIVNFLH